MGWSLLGSSSLGADAQPSLEDGEGRSLSNEPPSPSSFSPNELGTFHCQLFAWVLPFQLAKENWQARSGFSMDFKDILLQI